MSWLGQSLDKENPTLLEFKGKHGKCTYDFKRKPKYIDLKDYTLKNKVFYSES